MESRILNALGIDPAYIFMFMLALFIILFVLYVNVTVKYNRLKTSYQTFMRGKDGKTLEESMMEKFQEAEAIIKVTKQNRLDIRDMKQKLDRNFQKIGIVKYDAFNEMGGKLSFAIAMLDGQNNGWIMNAMHSREGCYTYVKEIVKAESYVELAEEEAEALAVEYEYESLEDFVGDYGELSVMAMLVRGKAVAFLYENANVEEVSEEEYYEEDEYDDDSAPEDGTEAVFVEEGTEEDTE